jgi:hypothetical protein
MPRSLGAVRLNWVYSLFAGVVACWLLMRQKASWDLSGFGWATRKGADLIVFFDTIQGTGSWYGRRSLV